MNLGLYKQGFHLEKGIYQDLVTSKVIKLELKYNISDAQFASFFWIN